MAHSSIKTAPIGSTLGELSPLISATPLPIEVTSPGHDSIDSGVYSDLEKDAIGNEEEEEDEAESERFFGVYSPLEEWRISARDVTVGKNISSSVVETVYRYVNCYFFNIIFTAINIDMGIWKVNSTIYHRL